MGDRLAHGVARQHPDLISRILTADRRRVAVLAVLAVDGVLCAIAVAFLLPLRVGGVPVPVSALIGGLVNAALVWAALKWTSSSGLAGLPLWCWLATVLVLTLGGPGDDVVFGGSGVMAYAALLLIVVGTAPPAWLLWRHVNAS